MNTENLGDALLLIILLGLTIVVFGFGIPNYLTNIN